MISIVILRMIQLVSLGKNEKLLSIFQIVSNEFNVMYDVELWSYSAILATPSADEITVKHHFFSNTNSHLHTHPIDHHPIFESMHLCACVVQWSSIPFPNDKWCTNASYGRYSIVSLYLFCVSLLLSFFNVFVRSYTFSFVLSHSKLWLNSTADSSCSVDQACMCVMCVALPFMQQLS